MIETKNSGTSEAEVSARVETLLGQMSLTEKIGQLNQVGGGEWNPTPEESIRKGEAGSVLWLNNTKRFNELQKIAVEESPSKIPLLFALDVIHGYRTIFPVPLAMASSWDPSVAEQAQAVAAREARAAGLHWTFGPMLDIARDARWGRIVEGAGEDPCLGAAMAAAQVRGFQGTTLGAPDRVVACAKHFAGYGAADGGRDYDPVYLSEAQLRNVYFPPFQAAVKAGVGTFMSAYMDLNNVPASGNRWLLNDILRGEWGFDGFVVSDAMAVGNLVIEGFARDGRDAALRALTAGLNMDMASNTYPEHLAGLVEDGTLAEAEIDAMVRPILAVKVRMGLFEQPYVDESLLDQVVALPEHRQAARSVAQRSMVLLRNEGGLLPLAKDLKNVAVIGPVADSMEATEGSWMVFGHKPAAVTVLQGIRAKLPDARVQFAHGPEIRRDIPSFFEDFMPGAKKPVQTPEEADAAFQHAVDTAKSADVVIMVLGEEANMAGEAASRGSLDLPGRQEELLKAVVALGQAGGPGPVERTPVEHQLGGGERTGNPGSLGARDGRRSCRGGYPLWRCEPGRQAASHLPAQRQPRADVLCAHPDPPARGSPDVPLALLGQPDHAALSLRLRSQLHNLLDRESEPLGQADEGWRYADRHRRGNQHRQSCR